MSNRSASDINFIPVSVRSPSTLAECRDSRIRFLAEMLTATEQAADIQLAHPANLDAWSDGVANVLQSMDQTRRLLLPLEGQSPHIPSHVR